MISKEYTCNTLPTVTLFIKGIWQAFLLPHFSLQYVLAFILIFFCCYFFMFFNSIWRCRLKKIICGFLRCFFFFFCKHYWTRHMSFVCFHCLSLCVVRACRKEEEEVKLYCLNTIMRLWVHLCLKRIYMINIAYARVQVRDEQKVCSLVAQQSKPNALCHTSAASSRCK